MYLLIIFNRFAFYRDNCLHPTVSHECEEYAGTLREQFNYISYYWIAMTEQYYYYVKSTPWLHLLYPSKHNIIYCLHYAQQ